MAYLDKLVERIFASRNQQPIVHEVIRRSERDKTSFGEWKASSRAPELLEEISRAYYLKKAKIQGNLNVHIFKSVNANGFALTFHPDIKNKEFQCLFDLFKENVQAMGYRLAASDRRIVERSKYIESKEKHYLKPNITREQMKDGNTCVEQLYGNILIEYVLMDDKPSFLKVLSTIHMGPQYKEPLHFEDFLDRLLS